MIKNKSLQCFEKGAFFKSLLASTKFILSEIEGRSMTKTSWYQRSAADNIAMNSQALIEKFTMQKRVSLSGVEGDKR